MTPAELKTTREACGLSVPDLAALAGVQERTVRYWESGHTAVPDDVAETVQRIDAMLTQAADQAVAQVRELQAQHGSVPEEIVLLRYPSTADLHLYQPEMRPLPATCHAAMLYRTRSALADLHVPSRIIYMDPAAYSAWLGRRKDTEAQRSAWAALQPVGEE